MYWKPATQRTTFPSVCIKKKRCTHKMQMTGSFPVVTSQSIQALTYVIFWKQIPIFRSVLSEDYFYSWLKTWQLLHQLSDLNLKSSKVNLNAMRSLNFFWVDFSRTSKFFYILKIHSYNILYLCPCYLDKNLCGLDMLFMWLSVINRIYQVSSPIIIAWFMSTVLMIPTWASIPALFRPTAFKHITSGKDGAIIASNATAQIRLR